MKFFYIASTALFLCGLALVFYLIPSAKETALIKFKGQEYASSSHYYHKQPSKKGTLSMDELHALVVLNIKEGKINEAVRLMEEYVQTHPDDIHGYQVLAQLYQENQQFEEYFNILEQELKMGNRTRALYNQLAFWYELQNNQHKYCHILSQMVDEDLANVTQYYALAECYALEKKYDDVQKIMEQRRHKFPSKLEIKDFFFEIWAARKNPKNTKEKMQWLIDAFIGFLQKQKDPELAYAAIVNSQADYPEYAPYLISQLRNQLNKDSEYVKGALIILWDYPEYKEEVFQELHAAYQENSLPEELQDLFFKVLSEKKHAALLKEMIPRSHPENFSSENVYTFISNFMESKNTVLIEQLYRAYPQKFLEHHPLIATFFAIALHEKNVSERVQRLIQEGALTYLNTFLLFSLTANAGYNDLSLELGSHLYPYFGFSATEVFDIALIYIKLGKSNEIFDKLKQSFPEGAHLQPNNVATPAFVLLYAEKGKVALTKTWLAKQVRVEESILSGLYTVAAKKQEFSLMYALVLRLAKEYPSPLYNAYLGETLVRVGEMKKGIEILNKLSTQFPNASDIESIYYASLLFAIKKDRTFEGTLANFLETKSMQKNLSVDELRDYAAIYLDVLNDYQKTEKLLMRLVATGKAQEGDIDLLANLIGPHASPQKLNWMVRQAQRAEENLWPFWLEKLLYAGGYCAVIELFEKKLMQRPNHEIDLKAAFTYLAALSFLKKKCELKKAIDLVLTKAVELKDLEKLVSYTEEANYQNARKEIWKKITAKKPHDPQSWQNLATVLFDQNEFCAAAQALLRYFALEKNPCSPNSKLYQSLFQFAEILYLKNCYQEASTFYSLTLCQIYAAKKKTIAMRETESIILFKLGAKNAALKIAYQLYEDTSRDPGYTASYVNMMMDAGAFDIAKGLILEGVCK